MLKTQSMDALLNEYKGSLFEFLVGKCLAQKFAIEDSFLTSLSSDQLGMLSQQEKFLRNQYPKLLNSLPEIAESCSIAVVSNMNILSLSEIQLLGMNANAKSEADLCLVTKDCNTLVSLKLSKFGSFTNTKSAGVKSFLYKYFEIDQTDFNDFYDRKFSEFAFNMYKEQGEEVLSDFSNWEELGLPTLPGKLEGKQRELLLEFYSQINQRIFDILSQSYIDEPNQFFSSIFPLAGFSDEHLSQVTCFYKEEDTRYFCNKTLIKKKSDLNLGKANKLIFKKSDNSIKISGNSFSLLIRLKPMNKFTHKSYKINCALKFN